MNFGMHISCMVEEKLALIQRPVDWTQADEAQAYERCLKEALEDNGRAWADGNIRIGDYILLSMSLYSLFFFVVFANQIQLILILVSLRTVFWMLAPKWNNHRKLV
jgi:hypothetical protein